MLASPSVQPNARSLRSLGVVRFGRGRRETGRLSSGAPELDARIILSPGLPSRTPPRLTAFALDHLRVSGGREPAPRSGKEPSRWPAPDPLTKRSRCGVPLREMPFVSEVPDPSTSTVEPSAASASAQHHRPPALFVHEARRETSEMPADAKRGTSAAVKHTGFSKSRRPAERNVADEAISGLVAESS